jgi:hypothetical protein
MHSSLSMPETVARLRGIHSRSVDGAEDAHEAPAGPDFVPRPRGRHDGPPQGSMIEKGPFAPPIAHWPLEEHRTDGKPLEGHRARNGVLRASPPTDTPSMHVQSAIPSPWHATPAGAPERFQELSGSRQSPVTCCFGYSPPTKAPSLHRHNPTTTVVCVSRPPSGLRTIGDFIKR